MSWRPSAYFYITKAIWETFVSNYEETVIVTQAKKEN